MIVDNRSVVLSAGNIKHYHHTAFALQQAGLLHRYLCVLSGEDDLGKLSYLFPAHWRNRLRGKHLADLDLTRTETIAWPYLLTQIGRRLRLLSKGRMNAYFGRLYDWATEQRVNGCEVFHFVKAWFVTPVRDLKALTDRLRWYYENPRKWVQMSRNAAERVQQFTWAEYGRRLLEAYDDILDRQT